MPQRRTNPVLTLIAASLLALFGSAQAQPLATTVTHHDVGFQIDVPEGWTITTYEDEARIDLETDEAILIVDAFELDLIPDDDLETIFEYILDQLVDAFDMTDAGIVEDQFLGALEAVRIDFEGVVGDATVFGTLIVAFDDAYFYYVMFATDADVYDAYEDTLLAMVDSFTLLD